MRFDHTAEGLFFLGVAFWLGRWVVRTLREVGGDEREHDAPFLQRNLDNLMLRESHQSVVVNDGELPHAGHPLGTPVAIHCPSCGADLAPEPLPFAIDCPGCHRRVNVRGDGPGRMSIVVVELK